PASHRGRFAGLGSKAVIDHLKSLGVTTLELLPIHPCFDEQHLHQRGLTNYWGYNPFLYFPVDSRFASSATPGVATREFREMVKKLHGAGIEVILDVVFNHTAEAGISGPTVSFRGIDSSTYYHFDLNDPGRMVDFTGCGNTLRASHPTVRSMIVDALRYYREELHVDGFRFDLASAICRDDAGGFSAQFAEELAGDPAFDGVKLIMEPWDASAEGYRVGAYKGCAEWNDRFRDGIRRFHRGERHLIGEFATRLSGSSDLFSAHDSRAHGSLNFVTCHDGFTLRDLVSYERKHNEDNLEQNADGRDENFSSNCGVEGEADQSEILARRVRRAKNMLAALFLSKGVPMLTAGDEFWRTLDGNNNAYCLDRDSNYVAWKPSKSAKDMLECIQQLAELRRSIENVRSADFYSGKPAPERRDVVWLNSDGLEMMATDWQDPKVAFLGAHLHATESVADDSVLALFNASEETLSFPLPAGEWILLWSSGDCSRGSCMPGGTTHLVLGETTYVFKRAAQVKETKKKVVKKPVTKSRGTKVGSE
ncbi:MAG: glycogen debranching enzyme GlgX, partial [Deltaproteobacteria bacterium]|nr:glycogen debranching enzyme GlgX [Deltaproteobacteria bacterium]